jgi:hypothetical protein
VNGVSSELCDGDDNVRLDHGACLPNDKIIFESNIQRRSMFFNKFTVVAYLEMNNFGSVRPAPIIY